MEYDEWETPLGRVLAVKSERGLVRFSLLGNSEPDVDEGWARRPARFADVRRQFAEYCRGKRRSFDLPLDPRGTAFQRKVWKALVRIPYGATASYGDIAKAIRQPSAVRAVGGANNKNPLWVIVPCHRVIGKDGSMTGYGGGIALKRKLLALETRHASP
ncbi:MAG: methylated-DNA--[protein]-cysteine S-methyltransferase [Polyangiaceae bacterium]